MRPLITEVLQNGTEKKMHTFSLSPGVVMELEAILKLLVVVALRNSGTRDITKAKAR
jgi:hypothetical protein